MARNRIPKELREQHVEQVRMLISQGKTYGEIKRFFREKYGYRYSTVDQFRTEAHKRIREEQDDSPDVQREKSLAFYDEIISGRIRESSPRDRIRARECKDMILGLRIQEHHHTGTLQLQAKKDRDELERLSKTAEGLALLEQMADLLEKQENPPKALPPGGDLKFA